MRTGSSSSSSETHRSSRLRFWRAALVLLTCSLLLPALSSRPVEAQTAFGEIEGRAAPVSHRRCIAGTNAGALCNEDVDCPASACQDRNIFNVSVNVRFSPTSAELQSIRDAFADANDLLWDVTDCQAQFGQVSILNNPSGTRGTYWINPSGGCAADTGSWGQYSGGNITVGKGSVAAGCLVHEFSHLVFDVRDEYESRAPGCGAAAPGQNCPVPASFEEECLMECCVRNVGTEFCWGQGNPLDFTDITGGNHDPTTITEQSRCRSNRSCWDQIGWSWPNTFLVPAGAPSDNCPIPPDDVVFLDPPSTSRVVLVLDRSGSMSSESPARIARLKVAALDFVDLAENGMELGLVSFASTAADAVAVAALTANRTAYNNAINALSPSGATNIGDGLQHARDMIMAAGGVTADTYVVLMTDGRNNRPSGTAAADLQSKIDTLLMDGIPVYVTCTGDDLGLDSQCAEIATGTNGFYVDSQASSQLPEAFADIHELIRGRHPTRSVRGDVNKGGLQYDVLVEPGARAATFVGLCRETDCLAMVVIDPTGAQKGCTRIPQGQFCRFQNPEPGIWTVVIDPITQVPQTYLSRAYVANPVINVAATAQFPVVEPGNEQLLCAHPKSLAPLVGVKITGVVTKPDGSGVPVVLTDDGTGGDEATEDATYCASFFDTAQPGAYTALLFSDGANAKLAECDPPDCPDANVAPFIRETRFSFTVNDLPPGAIICTDFAPGQPSGKVFLPITLSDGSGVAGFQTDLLYDPSVLTPVSVQPGADTPPAAGWSLAGNLVGLGQFRVLGHSNPPTALGPSFKQVALVEFDIAPGAPQGTTTVSTARCVLSDPDGLRLPCNLCTSPGGVIIRDATAFVLRPIAGPVGVDRFDPLPFQAAATAVDSNGNLATGYNMVADMTVLDTACTGTLQPTNLTFVGGVGGPSNFRVACCIDPLLPATSLPLKLEATDAFLGIAGVSDPFQGVAKGDVDASGGVDVLDVTRTVNLSLGLPVPTPPPSAFQKWAADMLDPQCAPDGLVNVLDVIRVRNKALGGPALCPCGRGVPAPAGATASLSAQTITLRIVRDGRDHLLVVEGVQDLGGFQIELAGFGERTVVLPAGLVAEQSWQVASNVQDSGGTLRVVAYSNSAAGIAGSGALLRIQGPRRPRLVDAIASDSVGSSIEVRTVRDPR